jgi:hypothetical protein
MGNRYIDWLEKNAGVDEGIVGIGKGIAGGIFSTLRAGKRWLGKTVNEATGQAYYDHVNKLGFGGKAGTAKLLGGVGDYRRDLRNIATRLTGDTKTPLKSLRASPFGQEVIDNLHTKVHDIGRARVKLGLLAAGGLYGLKKYKDHRDQQQQQTYYNSY